MTSSLAEWLAEQACARDAAGLTRRLTPRSAAQQGEPVVDLAGNDYLGLSRHPQVIAAAQQALHDWGAGATASRLVTGSTELHAEVEQNLAEFTGQAAGLVFSSGYLANLAAVTALAGPDAVIISDAHVHASLIDACRLARSRVVVVPHQDLAEIATALAQRSEPRALVLCESIYSVLGDAAPLTELAELVQRHHATLIVDEAHSLGALGPGMVARAGLANRPNIVITGTLSKALGSQGGLVLGSLAVREQLINAARSFIFDTGLAPASVAAAGAALDLVSPQRTAQLRAVIGVLAGALGVQPPPGAILTVRMPSPQAALAAARACGQAGVRVGCFRPPSVPDGHSRIRVTARANLTPAELEQAAEVLSASLRSC